MKTGKKYRHLYTTPPIDYCGFMNGMSSNIFMKSVVNEMVAKSNVFHPCPFVGTLEVKNLHMKDEGFYSIYPSGNYRNAALIANKRKTFLNVTVEMIVKHSLARSG